jgi:hypothetical protein
MADAEMEHGESGVNCGSRAGDSWKRKLCHGWVFMQEKRAFPDGFAA